MNETQKLETLLRKAPRLKAPLGLREKLAVALEPPTRVLVPGTGHRKRWARQDLIRVLPHEASSVVCGASVIGVYSIRGADAPDGAAM